MKTVKKITPVSLYDIQGMEHWLEDMANEGLFPVSLGCRTTFREGAVPGTRFRLDPFANRMGEGTEPTPEKLELYHQAKWEYAFSIGQAYFLFYNTDPDAPELYTDYQSQGMSLDRLTRRLRAYRWQRIIAFGTVVLILLTALFLPGRFDVQPAPLARLPLLLLYLFYPPLLFFLIIACLYEPSHRRDQRILMATYNALKEGLPPPSPGPSQKIVRENLLTLALIPVLASLLLFSLSNRSGKTYSLGEFTKPYVSLTELESVTVFPSLSLDLRTKDNEVNRQFSLLAPEWYEVKQYFLSWEMGRENGYSPDPQDGRYTYTPGLTATYFRLLIPALARPVAEAQLDFYRAVNLKWTYEEAVRPGMDFVILAKADDETFQMAALCRGGQLAVFSYSGMEDLADHLDVLAAAVS